MSSHLDHFRSGAIALNSSIAILNGSYFGILIVADGTTFSTLSTDAINPGVLTGITYGAGTYLPLNVSSVKVSAGAALVGKTTKTKR